MTHYQYIFDYLLYFQRYALDKLFISSIRKGNNSVNTGDRVMVLALCNSPHDPLSVYQVSLNHLVYFQRYAPDKLFIAKIKKGSNSVKTGDRVMVLALCSSAHDPLSVYQVSFNSLTYFQRYAPDKLFSAKNIKGSNSINTGDRITVLVLCNSPHSPLSLYQVSLNYLQYF